MITTAYPSPYSAPEFTTDAEDVRVRVQFSAINPDADNPTRYTGIEYLDAADQPQDQLYGLLEARHHWDAELIGATIVCARCQFPAEGMSHASC